MESLARLKPVFRTDGTVTAGNASPLNDGAAALFLAGDAGLARLGGPTPLARIVSRAAAGVDPQLFGIGPVEAANRALAARRHRLVRPRRRRAQRGVRRAVAGLPAPLAGPGPRRSSTSTAAPSRSATRSAAAAPASSAPLAHELHRRGGGWGLAAICIGVGQGLAVVLHA